MNKVTMRQGVGPFSIGGRIFVVGAIPIVVATVIAIGASILLFEAERARVGAVVSTETFQTLTSLARARTDFIAGSAEARAGTERRFNELATTASGQLQQLAQLARTAEQTALIDTVVLDLNAQVVRMRSLVLSERESDQIVGDMSRRADALVAITDAARRRQQDENAKLVAILARKDAELEKNQAVVTTLREVQEAINTAELNRARIGRPVFQIEFLELAADLQRLDAISTKLRAVLSADGEEDAAKEASVLLAAYRYKSRSDDDLSRALFEGFELTSATQSGRALIDWCDRLVRANVARQSRLHDEVTRLIRESVLSNEAGLSAQNIALTTLKLARQTTAALARRSTSEASAALEEGADLFRNARTLPVPAGIREDMTTAIDGWRMQLAATIGKVGTQNGTITAMDRLAATMSTNARSLSRAFIDDADQFGNFIRQLLLIGAVGALLLGAGAAVAVARSITRPLRVLQNSMLAAADDPAVGNIGLAGRRDELGDIARATNIFLAQIRRREADWRDAAKRTDDALNTLRQAKEDLIRSERLASLGQLVAGVSHEISTPLGIALTTATQVQSEAVAFEGLINDNQLSRARLTHFSWRIREGAQLLTSNLIRAADLLHSFKQVAADQAIEDRRCLNLAEWLDDLLKSLRALVRRGQHGFVVDCPQDITLDTLPGILAQVVTNAVKNAVEHGLREQTEGSIEITARPDQDGIRISIADNGCGIDANDLKRAFDPFFTTARARGGTGLGLHIVHNLVVNRLHGTVTLHSQIGQGTVFDVWLPAHLG